MKVLYHCKCMKKGEEREVEVMSRDPEVVVTAWLNTVVRPAISKDHREKSPTCQRKKMDYIKIPHKEGEPVGSTYH